jgi:hypothetical protein
LPGNLNKIDVHDFGFGKDTDKERTGWGVEFRSKGAIEIHELSTTENNVLLFISSLFLL